MEYARAGIEVVRSGHQWVGWCQSLQVASCGDTKDEARRATLEACTLWVQSCIQRGTIREALAECAASSHRL